VLWALATLRRADKPLLDAATRALGSKAGGADSADVAAALWGLASLGHGVDAGTLKKAAAAVGAGGSRDGIMVEAARIMSVCCLDAWVHVVGWGSMCWTLLLRLIWGLRALPALLHLGRHEDTLLLSHMAADRAPAVPHMATA
jgi:hypothetical protein